MFILKKIISAFILPPGFFILIFILIGLILFRKKELKLSILFFILSIFIWLFSTDILGSRLKCLVEEDYVLNRDIKGDVIIVLGAGLNECVNGILGNKASLTQEAKERVLSAYFLHKKMKIPIILTGGSVFGSEIESKVAKDFLKNLGIDEKNIYIETKSRDTYENAIFSKKICDEKGFKNPIIVTNAWHMKRSLLSFKKAGFKDIGYAVSSSSCSKQIKFLDFLPGDFRNIREYFHEIYGILFYKLFL